MESNDKCIQTNTTQSVTLKEKRGNKEKKKTSSGGPISIIFLQYPQLPKVLNSLFESLIQTEREIESRHLKGDTSVEAMIPFEDSNQLEFLLINEMYKKIHQ